MSPPRRLNQLTGLRFAAAMLVVFSHLEVLERSSSSAIRVLYDQGFRQGSCGVAFFFILSGAVISQAYGRRLARGEISVRVFLARRAARIFPLHWATASIFALYLIVVQGEVPRVGVLLPNLFLVQGWWPDPAQHFSLNGPSWSLSDEMFFYAAFPLLAALGTRVLVRLVLVGGLGIVGAAAYFSSPTFDPTVEWAFYVFPPVRMLEFVVGILIQRHWSMAPTLRFGTATEVAVLAAVVATAGLVAVTQVLPVWRYQIVWLPVMSAVVFVFARGQGALTRLFASPLLVLLGDASFALYLTHRPLLTLGEKLAPAGSLGLSLALVAIVVIVSVIVHVYFDAPIQRLLRSIERQIRAGLVGSRRFS